jgi:hypothetical protein
LIRVWFSVASVLNTDFPLFGPVSNAVTSGEETSVASKGLETVEVVVRISNICDEQQVAQRTRCSLRRWGVVLPNCPGLVTPERRVFRFVYNGRVVFAVVIEKPA